MSTCKDIQHHQILEKGELKLQNNYTLTRMLVIKTHGVSKNAEQLELLCIVGKDLKWYNHFGSFF